MEGLLDPAEPQDPKPKIEKIPYRPVDVKRLSDILATYKDESSFGMAVKLLVDEGLLILKRDG